MSSENTKPLEIDMPLSSFGDFSSAIPKRWRTAPLYVCNSIGRYEKAVRLFLVRDALGKKLVVIDTNYSDCSQSKPKGTP